MKTSVEIRECWRRQLGNHADAAVYQRACVYDMMNLAASRADERVTAETFDLAHLKRLYRASALALHPDQNGIDRRYFQQMNATYRFLLDEGNRRQLRLLATINEHPFANDWQRYMRSHRRPVDPVAPAATTFRRRATGRNRRAPQAATMAPNQAELRVERQRLLVMLGLILGVFALTSYAINALCPRRQTQRHGHSTYQYRMLAVGLVIIAAVGQALWRCLGREDEGVDFNVGAGWRMGM